MNLEHRSVPLDQVMPSAGTILDQSWISQHRPRYEPDCNGFVPSPFVIGPSIHLLRENLLYPRSSGRSKKRQESGVKIFLTILPVTHSLSSISAVARVI